MAAEELSNKEIAQALFVTVKTVEQHLGRVYRKLDISSRRQLGPALGAPAETPTLRRKIRVKVGLSQARRGTMIEESRARRATNSIWKRQTTPNTTTVFHSNALHSRLDAWSISSLGTPSGW